jgi:hypothetical protein
MNVTDRLQEQISHAEMEALSSFKYNKSQCGIEVVFVHLFGCSVIKGLYIALHPHQRASLIVCSVIISLVILIIVSAQNIFPFISFR